MVGQAIDIIGAAMSSCLVWFQTLVDAVGGRYFIVAAFTMAAIMSLIVFPIRGSGFSSVSFSDFTKGAASFRPARHSNGKVTGSNANYSGKYLRQSAVRGSRGGNNK